MSLANSFLMAVFYLFSFIFSLSCSWLPSFHSIGLIPQPCWHSMRRHEPPPSRAQEVPLSLWLPPSVLTDSATIFDNDLPLPLCHPNLANELQPQGHWWSSTCRPSASWPHDEDLLLTSSMTPPLCRPATSPSSPTYMPTS